MIETIRQLMQNKGAKIILWFTLLSLAGGSFMSFFRFSRKFSADSIGTVNDQDIGFKEFRRRYAETQQMVQEIRKIYGPQADLVLKMWGLDKRPQAIVLEGLIAEKVMQSAADRLGGHISKEYIQSKLHDQAFVQEHLSNLVPPQAYIAGALDVASLKYFLQRQGISEEEFEEAVNSTMKRVLLQRLVEAGIYIPRVALKEMYERLYLNKKYAILSLPFEKYLTNARIGKLSDADTKKYFEAHKEQYRIPEKRSARLWAFDADGYGVLIAEKDIESAYHKRKKAYIEKPEEVQVQHILLPFEAKNKIEVRTKAQELLKQVREKPDTFESVAKKHADAQAVSMTIIRGGKNQALEDAAFALQSQGISAVIDTPKGFEILKLISKKGPVYKPLEKVKDDLVKTLKQEKFSQDFSKAAQRVISQASDLPNIVTKFIAEKKAQAFSIAHKTRTETIGSEKLFGLQRVGNRAFYLAEGKGFIVELTQITPSKLQALSAVQQQVTEDIYKEKAHAALEADLDSAIRKIKDGKEKLEAAAKRLKGSVEVTDWIDLQDKAALKKLREKQIPLEQFPMLTRPGAVVREITPTHGYLIVLRQMKPLNEKAFHEKIPSLQRDMQQQEANLRLSAFAQTLQDAAKIDINQEFVRQAAR